MMRGQIIEILALIAEGINNNYSTDDLEEIVHRNKKFKANEIAAAYNLMYEKIANDIVNEATEQVEETKSLRYFSEEEKTLIGEKNLKHLLDFYHAGLVNEHDIEVLIEEIRIIPEQYRSYENINYLILTLFLDLDELDMPGSRILLYSSDTIN